MESAITGFPFLYCCIGKSVTPRPACMALPTSPIAAPGSLPSLSAVCFGGMPFSLPDRHSSPSFRSSPLLLPLRYVGLFFLLLQPRR